MLAYIERFKVVAYIELFKVVEYIELFNKVVAYIELFNKVVAQIELFNKVVAYIERFKKGVSFRLIKSMRYGSNYFRQDYSSSHNMASVCLATSCIRNAFLHSL